VPTGYTVKLMESGQTFKEFVMTCARAFGACIDMRDSPMDKPILEKFSASIYHAENIKKAKDLIESLNAMTEKEKLEYGEKLKLEDVKNAQEYLEKREKEENRLIDMEGKVMLWNPPTSEHAGLKEFMLQQIGVSKTGLDYCRESLRKAKDKNVLDYYYNDINAAVNDIAYHEKEQNDEIGRVNERSKWIKDLRNSI
jgi:hypothetical protein